MSSVLSMVVVTILCGSLFAQTGDIWVNAPNFNSGVGAPSIRYDAVAVWTGERLLVWGGRGPMIGTGPIQTLPSYNNGGSYDPLTDTWEIRPNLNSGASSVIGAGLSSIAWTGHRMVVWSGVQTVVLDATQNPPTITPWNDSINYGAMYDYASDTWVNAPMLAAGIGAPLARGNSHLIWTGSKIVALFGYGNGALWDGGIYDPYVDRWDPQASVVFTVPPIDFHHGPVWTGEAVMTWAGPSPTAHVFNAPSVAGGMFDPVAMAWLSKPNLNAGVGAPPANNTNGNVWTGLHYVVFGGNSGNVGGVYDPAVDQWLSKPNLNTGVGAPSGRSFTERIRPVWTGARLLVWGGAYHFSTPVSRLGNGGQYDPAADAWDVLPTLNNSALCPDGRTNHNLVWCGDRMVLWGGETFNGGNTNTGHIYKPPSVAPSISSTPIVNASINQPYKYKIVVYSTPYSTITTSTLPSWLTLSVAPSNGAWGTGIYGNIAYLEGTPPSNALGQSTVIQVMAGNGVGTNATQTFTLTVTDPPVFTTTPPTVVENGDPYTYTPLAVGSPPPTISAAGVPTWLTWNGTTLSGTPTAADIGTTAPITLTASAAPAPSATQVFTIEVRPAAPVLVSPHLPVAVAGVAYTHIVEATGFPAPTFTIIGLPAWLTESQTAPNHNRSTVVLSGTPPLAVQGQVFTITVVASNGHSPAASRTSILYVAPPKPIASALADVNEDGNVNVLDLQRVINIVLAVDPPSFVPHPTLPAPAQLQRGDLDASGVVDVVDIQALVNAILGR